ncbi:type II toxin-antitoxin system RatA family toxin [Alphaproteobacteria bacterium]|jgi:coenzyme Q-binding protein COQ10|nr:type II toxin-antitoxin system RatA family toxin [Alphaproteobacteria bacterium]MBT5799288.1 type II toxin-antitoxin system RatA family toxin [Alphaproteobacteria bacterium]MDA9190722.1 type II toxin-antitoxin system RatA family toxin [Alphaproteobacteria bacterium]MDA9815598.1 type II toxin-antitoxin system RatA family toxin [Alphaproteobacteria bacterium]MDC0462038.1 type II toxin-antitoxin system RatA family toxin [Alphaproteobacteria bacterium]
MTVHSEKRIIHHTPEELFDLVADVKLYPEFLPWCLAARIRSQTDKELLADLIIGFQVFKEQFTSKVELNRKDLIIDTTYADGPFRYLRNHWKFLAHPSGCEIDFYVDFEFKNRLLQTVMETLFTEAVRRMVRAFENRADALYKNNHSH